MYTAKKKLGKEVPKVDELLLVSSCRQLFSGSPLNLDDHV